MPLRISADSVPSSEPTLTHSSPASQTSEQHSPESSVSPSKNTETLPSPYPDVKQLICYTHEHCKDHGYESCRGSCSGGRPGTCFGGEQGELNASLPSNEIDRITEGYEPCSCDRYGSKVDSAPIPPSCSGGNKSGGKNGYNGDNCPEGRDCGPVVTRCACDGQDGRDPASACTSCPAGYTWCYGGICVAD